MSPKTPMTRTVAKALVLAEAIQSLGEIPSGELYAHVMGHFSYEEYQTAIATLVRVGVVTNGGHLLRWSGR